VRTPLPRYWQAARQVGEAIVTALVHLIPSPQPASCPVLPVLPARGMIDTADDQLVSELARRNRADVDVRNALYVAYFPRLQRLLTRLWYRNLQEFGCEYDDLEQELFLIFQTLLDRWSGSGSLSAYIHGAVPWRLYDAARRLAPREQPLGDCAASSPNSDVSHTDAEFVVLVNEVAKSLSGFDRDLFLWHVRDQKPLADFASARGVHRRTVRRAWLRLQQHLRRELAP
jgi:RNA polymerase sigma factor (sigma-70 family)